MRSYVGTPFQHQARLPGVGLDCIGAVICAAREIGIKLTDRRAYGRSPNPNHLLPDIMKNAIEVPFEERQLGDVPLFYFARPHLPQHVGVLSEDDIPGRGLIHAYSKAKRVVETDFSGQWLETVHSIWRLRAFVEAPV